MTSNTDSSPESRPPRPFASLILSINHCALLREAIRPLEQGREAFCIRIYGLYHDLETDPDVKWRSIEVTEEEILLVNHHLSAADGDEAIDVLKQSRAALFELRSGEESVPMASSESIHAILDVDVGKPPLETV